MKVKFSGVDCEVSFCRYGNGNTAIQLFGAEGTEYEGELVCVASVNGDMIVDQDIVGIKTWSENTGIVSALIEGKVIEGYVLFTAPAGFVDIEYYKLTEIASEKLQSLRGGMKL